MARREFPKSVKVSVIKRATRNGVTYCECCGALCKSWHFDHAIADSHGGEPTLENCQLICLPCHSEKTRGDVKTAAKIKRVEAKHLGADVKKSTIHSRGFAKKVRTPKPSLPPRSLYE